MSSEQTTIENLAIKITTEIKNSGLPNNKKEIFSSNIINFMTNGTAEELV